MRPIFISGCDRSGTTLLGRLLGGHSQCFTIPESHFFIDALRKFNSIGSFDIISAWETIKQNWRYRIWKCPETTALVKSIEEANTPQELMECIVKHYYQQHFEGKIDHSFWVDHTPMNIHFMKTLFDLYPESKLVHIVRDGRAVASSVLPLDWGPVTIRRAAYWWIERLVPGLAAESAYPSRILRIRYEDVVSQPDQELRKIQQFLGLPPEKLLADSGSSFTLPKYTQHQHKLVGEHPSPDRADAWRNDLSSRDIETFEYLTGELLEYLGYSLIHGIAARPPSDETPWGKVKCALLEYRNKRRRIRRIRNAIGSVSLIP